MARAAGAGQKKQGPMTAPSNEVLDEITPPPQLRDDHAVNIWATQSQVLLKRQILTVAYAPMLLAYCNSFSLMLEADKAINKNGLTVTSAAGGAKKNPELNARNDAINSMTRLGSLLGLDPTSYQRMTGGGGGDGTDNKPNPYSEFAN